MSNDELDVKRKEPVTNVGIEHKKLVKLDYFQVVKRRTPILLRPLPIRPPQLPPSYDEMIIATNENRNRQTIRQVGRVDRSAAPEQFKLAPNLCNYRRKGKSLLGNSM
jgi:hypothetical protein